MYAMQGKVHQEHQAHVKKLKAHMLELYKQNLALGKLIKLEVIDKTTGKPVSTSQLKSKFLGYTIIVSSIGSIEDLDFSALELFLKYYKNYTVRMTVVDNNDKKGNLIDTHR